MKWTKALIQTLRDDPADAEIDSHKLMVRAGLMKKVAGGLYTYLPLGMRTLNKVQKIVREEMDRAGAERFVLPVAAVRPSAFFDSARPGPVPSDDRLTDAERDQIRYLPCDSGAQSVRK